MKERNALHKELLSFGIKNKGTTTDFENAFSSSSTNTNPLIKKLTCDAPVASHDLFDSDDWCPFRQNMITNSLSEFNRWTGSAGAQLIENDPLVLPFLKEYWFSVASLGNAPNKTEIINVYPVNSAKEINPGASWGGAFVSHVADKSRTGTPVLFNSQVKFPFSGLNLINIVQALRNKIFTDKNATKTTISGGVKRVTTIAANFRFPHFYGLSNILDSFISLQPGDILCFNTVLKDNSTTQHSYGKLATKYGNNTNVPVGSSNCEIIVDVVFDENDCTLTVNTIGGNLKNSVRKKTFLFTVNKFQNTKTGAVFYRLSTLSLNLFGIIKFPVCSQMKTRVIPKDSDPIKLKDPFSTGGKTSIA